jgi:hypothetical protein
MCKCYNILYYALSLLKHTNRYIDSLLHVRVGFPCVRGGGNVSFQFKYGRDPNFQFEHGWPYGEDTVVFPSTADNYGLADIFTISF